MGDYEQVEIPADDVPDAPPGAPAAPAPKKPSAVSNKPSPASKASPKPSPKSKSNPSSGKKPPTPGGPLRDDDINLNSHSVAPGSTSKSQLSKKPKAADSKKGAQKKGAKQPGGFFSTKFPKLAYVPSVLCAVTSVVALYFAFCTLL